MNYENRLKLHLQETLKTLTINQRMALEDMINIYANAHIKLFEGKFNKTLFKNTTERFKMALSCASINRPLDAEDAKRLKDQLTNKSSMTASDCYLQMRTLAQE